jgi:hypothetical protein
LIVRIITYNKECPHARCQVYWAGCAPSNDLRGGSGFCRQGGDEAIFETKAETILQFVHGLRGILHVTFEEGTWAHWLHDLLKPHVTEVLVCDPRKNNLGKNEEQE